MTILLRATVPECIAFRQTRAHRDPGGAAPLDAVELDDLRCPYRVRCARACPQPRLM